MSALYAESSAVLRWLLGAPDGPAIQALLGAASEVVSSALTVAEVHRTLHRLTALGTLTPEARDRAQARFSRALARWAVHAVTEDLLRRAGEGFPCEPVRTLDAVHLATAAYWAREIELVSLLSVDARVRENARALGLGVEPSPSDRES